MHSYKLPYTSRWNVNLWITISEIVLLFCYYNQSINRNRSMPFFQIGTWMRCHFSIRFQSKQNKRQMWNIFFVSHLPFFPNFQTKANINMHTNTFNEFITWHNFHLYVFQKCSLYSSLLYVECWLQRAVWLKKQFPPSLLFANCVLSAIDYSNFLSFSLPFNLILCISGTIIDFLSHTVSHPMETFTFY